MPHLFADISPHGLGHLAQTAPVLNTLARKLPDLRLTIRSGVAESVLRARIPLDFTFVQGTSDFGFVMRDATRIDKAASATVYRDFHANWAVRVASEAGLLANQKPDLVLTDVAYLPLAAAHAAGIRSLAMCSLNWADLFLHVFGAESWAPPIHAQILAAYEVAEVFLRLTPAMPMSSLPRSRMVAPVATLGRDRRAELRRSLNAGDDEKLVLIAFGGFDKDLGAERWPQRAGWRWLVPRAWRTQRADMVALEDTGLPFADLLCSADAAVTKPGYGTFVEAACGGTPLLYVGRDDWPEQDCLVDWLQANGRCREVEPADLMAGRLHEALDELWRQPAPPRPFPSGNEEAASIIATALSSSAR
jgi:hypothetical protein